MGNEWIALLPSIVFSRIEQEFSEELKIKYGMTSKNFSTVGSNDTPAVFPFVRVKTLPGLERGQDLEGKTINAGLFTFQIDVTDNGSQERTNTVAFEVLKIMKNMGFEITAMPNFEETKSPYRNTARYRRLIGSGDLI